MTKFPLLFALQVPYRCMYSSSSSSQSSGSSGDSSSSEDQAEMEYILGKCVKKNVSDTVHIVFLGCSNGLRPVFCLVSQRGGTQGCDCTVLWSAGIS